MGGIGIWLGWSWEVAHGEAALHDDRATGRRPLALARVLPAPGHGISGRRGERTDLGVDIGDGQTIIWTTTFAQYDLTRETPRGGLRIMLEFFVDDNQSVDALFTTLTDAGYQGRRAPFVTSFDAYMCLVDDPDGNTVLITAG